MRRIASLGVSHNTLKAQLAKMGTISMTVKIMPFASTVCCLPVGFRYVSGLKAISLSAGNALIHCKSACIRT